MLHISLFITLSSLLFAQSSHSMEKETQYTETPRKTSLERRNKFSLTRKRSADTPSSKQIDHTPLHNNDEISMPSVSITSSASMSTETSQSEKPKQKTLHRGKSVDSDTPTKPKNSIFLKMLSVSDSAATLSAPKTSPRSKLISSGRNLPEKRINLLINAVKNYDMPTIEEYFNNPDADLNQIDQHGNTALHYAVIKLTEQINNEAMLKKIIIRFLEDLRTDSSITREMDQRRASDILSGGQNPEIRTLLFARATLDIEINNQIGKILLENQINNIPLTDNLIKQTAEYIKNKIQLIEKEQEANNRDLPKEAKLPDYVTNEFICKIIKYRIPKEAYNVSDLQKTILKDIFAKERDFILLNVSIDFNEKSSKVSLDNILNGMSTSHNYLTKFTTRPCIFAMLETYYLHQEKEKNTSSIDFKKNSEDQAPTEYVSHYKKSRTPSDFARLYVQNNTNNSNSHQ